MVLDFAALPPEVNSALMYAGAGSGPLMAAAASWNNLAAELSTTATQWESIISTLTTSQWTGAGATSAAAAAQPYIEWLTTTAAAAEQAGVQAAASAASYEAAFAGTIPPAAVAANRAQLAALVASNILGINTPAILATEALYAEMWVQDATTMYVYSAAAAAAAALQPLLPATPTSNPAAAAAASVAAPAAALANPADALTDLVSEFGTTAFGDNIWAAFESAYPEAASFIQAADSVFGTGVLFNGIQQVGVTAAWFVGGGIPTAISYIHTAAAAIPAAAVSDVTPLGGAAAAEGTLVSATGAGAAGTMGQAATVGRLAVPATWTSALPATTAGIANTSAISGSGWTAAAAEGAGGAPLVGAPGGLAAAAKGAGAGAGPRYGFKPIVMPKPIGV